MRPAGRRGDSGGEISDQVSMTGITIERFADGKVVESWRCMDRLGLLQDLGAAP
jgi:hypothetical protein